MIQPIQGLEELNICNCHNSYNYDTAHISDMLSKV